MPVFESKYLHKIASSIFAAAGASADTAALVATSLVEANLAGHDSHGVIRISEYLNKIQAGKIVPGAEPRTVKETSSTLLVDGRWGFGQLTARWVMEKLIDKARTEDMASAGIFNCGHVGLAGTYPALAAEQGMIGMAFVNGGGTKPRVAPHGGNKAVFGTNPLAAALPLKGNPPIVMDFSTAIVASGKIRVLRDKGEPLPQGWILDRDGRPSRDPADYYNAGMLLPAAGHKGYALGLLVEVLGGLLTGAGSIALPDSGYRGGNGVFFLVLNVEPFMPLTDFTDQVATLAATIKGIPSTADCDEVLLPGEPERRNRRRRLAEGIPVPDATWESIVKAAADLGLEV